MRQRLTTIWVIAHREFVTRGRSKAFRISSAVLLIGLVLGIVIPGVLMRGSGHFRVAIAGAVPTQTATVPGAGLAAAIRAQAAAAGITVSTAAVADRAAAVALVDSGAADAAVAGTGEVIWKRTENTRLAPVMTAALTQFAITQRARALGLTPGQLGTLLAPARPAVTLLHPQPDRTPQAVMAMIGMILLFVALNFYGSYVLTGVVEEKTSRVVEVLLARVRPADLLAGKVAGIGMLGISQFAGLAVVAAVTLRIARPPNLPATAVPLIAGVVLWFVLGYSFYSVLYGALGALASRTEDAQAAIAPVTVFMMLIYFGAFTTMTSPRAWWVTAASFFPPTAPIFMPLRAALTDVPAWQIGAAVVLMLLGIAVLIRAGGRVYRGAVLHTGGRLGLRQAWHRG